MQCAQVQSPNTLSVFPTNRWSLSLAFTPTSCFGNTHRKKKEEENTPRATEWSVAQSPRQPASVMTRSHSSSPALKPNHHVRDGQEHKEGRQGRCHWEVTASQASPTPLRTQPKTSASDISPGQDYKTKTGIWPPPSLPAGSVELKLVIVTSVTLSDVSACGQASPNLGRKVVQAFACVSSIPRQEEGFLSSQTCLHGEGGRAGGPAPGPGERGPALMCHAISGSQGWPAWEKLGGPVPKSALHALLFLPSLSPKHTMKTTATATISSPSLNTRLPLVTRKLPF
ncbi:unnamed protein product [Leuciscus chuanchicus]